MLNSSYIDARALLLDFLRKTVKVFLQPSIYIYVVSSVVLQTCFPTCCSPGMLNRAVFSVAQKKTQRRSGMLNQKTIEYLEYVDSEATHDCPVSQLRRPIICKHCSSLSSLNSTLTLACRYACDKHKL